MLQFPLTFRNVFDDLLLLVGIEIANNAPMYIRERLINDINAALQLMQAAGGDYFTRQLFTVNATANTASYSISNSLQTVLTVRLSDGTPLRELATRGEYDLFSQVCLGASAANAKPLAYYLQRFFTSSGNPGDNAGVTLFLAPTPDTNYTVDVEAAGQSPNFGYADLTTGSQLTSVDLTGYAGGIASSYFVIYDVNSGICVWFTVDGVGTNPGQQSRQIRVDLLSTDTPASAAAKLALAMSEDDSFTATANGNVCNIDTDTASELTAATDGSAPTGFLITTPRIGSALSIIPIPHRYVASILLPIARYNVTTCPWYYKREGLPSIQADYRRALALLDINDPRWLPPTDAYFANKRQKAQGPVPLATPKPPVDEAA